ncbi:hypothetical protein SDC9_192861 [bioreactor metagenome]|uniref:Uncharacterized protein n=1 Tax=bioreactor metagenome TaxID=1076179 RepID=A0A645IAE0_9ZZZZ
MPCVQRLGNAVALHRGLGHVERKPHAHVVFQANAVHVVVDGFLQACAERIVIDAGGVNKAHVVARKRGLGQRQ